MSSANLLPPSAPPAEPLYPVVAAEPSQNFRLQKVNEISNTGPPLSPRREKIQTREKVR